MKELICVFIGGGAGSVLRYLVSLCWRQLAVACAFPWPTLLVNVLGCFLIGVFYQQSDRWGLSPEVRLLLTTGFCGGLTTFSTFSYESMQLLRGGMYWLFGGYCLLSVLLGLGAVLVAILVTAD